VISWALKSWLRAVNRAIKQNVKFLFMFLIKPAVLVVPDNLRQALSNFNRNYIPEKYQPEKPEMRKNLKSVPLNKVIIKYLKYDNPPVYFWK